VRALQRKSGLSVRAIQSEVDRLLQHDVILERRDGNRRYFCANQLHPLYTDLRNIVLKTSGLVEVLRDALGAKGIAVAFVFGSVAKSEERGHSDVDLFVIGTVGLREIARRLLGTIDLLGRDVNPHVFPVEEFLQRYRKGDSFLARVLGSKKLFIVGSENELTRLGT